jgi:hypothetical protein
MVPYDPLLRYYGPHDPFRRRRSALQQAPAHRARAQLDLCQTEAPAEIFVVDDASTDGGLDEVVRHRDERLKILRRSEPGPGGYAARNMAVLRAQSTGSRSST